MKDFDAMNAVYSSFFPENPPARSCVRAEVAIPADVEIEAIAMKSAG
jgi:2-iminobutanoate/2-iminopropanoate deaminase